jgi:hypothetical protein
VYLCMYVCMYVCMYMCMYDRVSLSVFMYVCMYVCMTVLNLNVFTKCSLQPKHIRIHTYMHACVVAKAGVHGVSHSSDI